MRVGILGPLEVVAGDGRVLLAGPKERTLMAVLAVHAGQVVSEARLVEALWGECPPRTATKTLQNYVLRVRKALARHEPGREGSLAIETSPPGYVLRAGPESVDARVVARLLGDARAAAGRGDAAGAARALADALARWRGPSLEEFADQPFAAAEAARLDELRHEVLEERLEADLALGRHRECVAELEALVALHPWRERLWGQLMVALYRSGRQADALRAYQRARAALVEDLGIEPGPALRRLERALIAQDPGLDLAPPPGADGGPRPTTPPGRAPARDPAGHRPGDDGPPLPAALAPAPGAVFVGRRAALARLTRAWQAASGDGGAGLVLLAGEPGIGKTTLAGALAHRVHDDGGLVLYGRWDEELGVPYQPFAEALRAYVRHARSGDLRREVGALGGELARLVPELPGRLADVPPPITAEPEVERYRLFEAVSGLLTGVANRVPVLLVLDDLQWAAKPSVLLLRHVLRAARGARLLVAATYRDAEVAAGHPLADALGDLHREPAVERVGLGGLDEDETVELVRARSGLDLSAPGIAVARTLHAGTAGNPFFLGEILRHLVETGTLEKEGGRWVARLRADELELPEGVREVVGRRLSRLSDAANRVLTVASVAGTAFSLDLLERLPEAAPDTDSLLDALDEAVRARVLAEPPGRPGHYTFSHALFRQALSTRLTAARRARLHRRVGEACEGLPDVESHLGALAQHFAAAGDAAKAAGYALRAARQAMDQLDFELAVAYLDRALGVVEASGPAADPASVADLLLALSDARRRAGDIAGAKREAVRAAEAARRLGSAERLAEATMIHAALGVAGRPDPEVPRLCEEALAGLGEEPSSLRARVLARLALHRALWEGQGVAVEGLAEEALDVARRVDDPRAVQAALFVRAVTLFGSPEVPRRLALAEEQTALAEATTDMRMQARGLRVRALARLELADLAGFDDDLARLDRLGEELRHWTYRGEAARWRVLRALLDGRFAEVEALADEMVERARDDPNSRLARACQLYFLRRDQGRLADALDIAAAAAAATPGIPAFRALVAMAQAELGDLDAARETLDALVNGDFAGLPRSFTWTAATSSLAVVCEALGDRARAEALLRLFRPHAGQLVVIGWGDVCPGAVDRYLGLLAATLGDWAEAEAHFLRAMVLEAGIGSAPLLSRTRTAYARAVLARAEAGDRARAAELLVAARADAERLGMRGLVAEIDELEAAEPAGSVRRAPGATTPGDRADPTARGLTEPPASAPGRPASGRAAR